MELVLKRMYFMSLDSDFYISFPVLAIFNFLCINVLKNKYGFLKIFYEKTSTVGEQDPKS